MLSRTRRGDLYESAFDRHLEYDRPVVCRLGGKYHNGKWRLRCNGGDRDRAVTDNELRKQYRYFKP